MVVTVGILGIVLASFVKGVIGLGFPTIATPLLALFMDVKTAVAILIFPNMVMDGIQALRRPGLAATCRRFGALYGLGVVGTFVGTYLLKVIPSRQVLMLLGLALLGVVGINASRFAFRVGQERERVLSPAVGLVTGVVGGITNVQGVTLVLYFYALGMKKAEFVRTLSVSFLIYKATQLLAVTQAGLMTARLFSLSVAATALGLGAFWLGVKVQDRVAQQTFNRAVLVFLAAAGAWLVIRGLR